MSTSFGLTNQSLGDGKRAHSLARCGSLFIIFCSLESQVFLLRRYPVGHKQGSHGRAALDPLHGSAGGQMVGIACHAALDHLRIAFLKLRCAHHFKAVTVLLPALSGIAYAEILLL